MDVLGCDQEGKTQPSISNPRVGLEDAAAADLELGQLLLCGRQLGLQARPEVLVSLLALLPLDP